MVVENVFVVCLGSSCRETAKNAITKSKGKDDREKVFFSTFQGAPKKKKGESVGCFCVGLRFFGLFCKNLLHVILTPPARYQHPHDANNPQVGVNVGHWGNYEPKWWPQGSTSSSSNLKNKTANTQEVNSTGW
jgi:hypothetical protein